MRAVGLAASLLLATSAFAQQSPVEKAVLFLRSSQRPDGAYGSSEEPVTTTAEVLSTFGALRLTDPGVELAQLYLADLPPAPDSELELRRRMALQGSPFSSSLPLLPSAGPGFDAPDAFHLAWALQWGVRTGEEPGELADLAHELVGKAHLDGCYAFVDNLASVELTSTAVLTLAPFTFYPEVRQTQSRGAACLLAKQESTGGFGSVLATAEAILALSTDSEATASLTLARQWLVAMQLPDGSWDESVRSTAVAARALGGNDLLKARFDDPADRGTWRDRPLRRA